MSNQSWFVKVTIWFMVFLMSVGFVALVITPFLGGGTLFGDPSGRETTLEELEKAREKVRKNDCTDKPAPTGERLETCRTALLELAGAHRALSNPEEGAEEPPKDFQRNVDRAGDAYRAAYELDPQHRETAEAYAAFLRDYGGAEQALPIWTSLVKQYPKEEDYLLQQAGAYEGLQRYDEAIATYRLFLRRFPDSGQADQVKEQIKAVQEQQKAEAAGGGELPIEVS